MGAGETSTLIGRFCAHRFVSSSFRVRVPQSLRSSVRSCSWRRMTSPRAKSRSHQQPFSIQAAVSAHMGCAAFSRGRLVPRQIWEQFWKLPASIEDVYSIIQPVAIRKIRRERPKNLALFMKRVSCVETMRANIHPHALSLRACTLGRKHMLLCILPRLPVRRARCDCGCMFYCACRRRWRSSGSCRRGRGRLRCAVTLCVACSYDNTHDRVSHMVVRSTADYVQRLH
jgi:hypothetical protein